MDTTINTTKNTTMSKQTSIKNTRENTVYSHITRLANTESANTALRYKDRPDMRYADLLNTILKIKSTLNAHGIGPNDRVAIVSPNGPDMALAILGIMSTATCAPLNPKYTAAEYEFYLADLNVKAVVIHRDVKSSIRDVVKQTRALAFEIMSDKTQSMDNISLNCISAPSTMSDINADDIAPPCDQDQALILHTSGTTSRPKIVPLSNDNICTSAISIAHTLQLSAQDSCFNIMPLFHIHGIMAGLLAPILSGGSVIASPGFSENPLFIAQFFPWLIALQPSWYTAVPTMHQAILAQGGKYPDIANQCTLRFVRSSSASLAPQIMLALEALFKAPVIEAYGMTEASHQMASNPLPPAQRKAKSVGIAAGPEVAIMDNEGRMVKTGEKGEIVIRGSNVMRAYENNPSANAQAFHGDWFRTGDEGMMDEDNYIFITGRLKEMINRGGEKISPREIDEVLLDHPAVGQAVAFAAPHPTLGEVAAAAIVLRDGEKVEPQALKSFAAERLAPFKIPDPIIFVDEIPKGPTGKLQRIGLAEKLL